MTTFSRFSSLLPLALLLSLVLPARAQTWQPTGGGSWTNTANWSPATLPDASTAQVVLSKNFTAAVAITLDRAAAYTVNKISYTDTTTPFVSCTISAGSPAGGSLIFAGTAPTIETPSAGVGDLTISVPVDLSLGLTKTGSRSVYLNGTVTGFGPGVYNTANSGMLAIGPATTIDWTTINKTSGPGAVRLDAVTTMALPATFSAVTAGELNLAPAAGTFSFDAAGFTKGGAGALRLSRPAVGPGGSATLQVNAGVLGFLGGFSGFASATVASGAGLQIAGNSNSTLEIPVPLILNGDNVNNTLNFYVNNTVIYNIGDVALNGNVIIRGYGLINTYNFNNPITGSSASSLLFKSEGGNTATHPHTFVLNAASTYAGSTALSAVSQQGILKLGVADALPVTTLLTLTGSANGNTSASLELNGKNQKLAGLIAAATVGGSRVINSGSAATLTVTNSSDCSFAGIVGMSGKANLSLVKQGAGTLTLSGTNVYSGGTTVSGGTLLANNTAGSGTGSGTVTVNGTGALGGKGIIQGSVSAAANTFVVPGGYATVGTLTLQNGLTLASGAAAVFDLAGTADVGGGVNDLLQLAGGDLTLNNTALVINPLVPLATGTPYTLITFSGTRSGTIGTVNVLGRQAASITYDDTPGAGKVMATFGAASPAAALVWNSTSSGAWDVGTSANWTNTTSLESPDRFYQSDSVTFDDTPGVQTSITLGTVVLPSSVTVNASANNFSLSGVGKISGGAMLTKSGSGALVVSTPNDYSGITTISGGVLQIGENGTTGSLGTSNVINDAALVYRRSNPGALANIISGTGSVAFNYTAAYEAFNLSGANTYSGGTYVSNGILVLLYGAAVGSGPVSITGTAAFQIWAPSAVTLTNDFVLNSMGSAQNRGAINHDGGSGVVTLDGSINLAGDSRIGVGGSSVNSMIVNGPISGPGKLYIYENSSTKLTLTNGANSWTGGTEIESTRVDITASGALGGGTVTIASNAWLTIWAVNGNAITLTNNFVLNGMGQVWNRGAINQDGGGGPVTLNGSITLAQDSRIGVGGGSWNSMTINGRITGPGKLTVDENATSYLVLTNGANDWVGGTVIETGRLFVAASGKLGSGAVLVKSGSELGGDGTVPGAVTLEAGGNLAPGGITNVVGTLTLQTTPAALNGVFKADVSTNGVCDLLQVQGNLTLTGLTLDIQDPGQLKVGRQYLLATCAPGGLVGPFAATDVDLSIWTVKYDNAAGEVRLVGHGTLLWLR